MDPELDPDLIFEIEIRQDPDPNYLSFLCIYTTGFSMSFLLIKLNTLL